MVVSGVLGTIGFLIVFHRRFAEPLLAFLAQHAIVPLLAALAGGFAGWAVCGAAASDPSTWTRAQALRAVVLGGAVHALVAIAVLAVSRFLTLAEVRQVMELVRGRVPVATPPASGA
jgi:hypothetical protein